MDHELKQRLIGALVVTALAAIFIPMLFDDPVDDRTQQVSELTIPPVPAVATSEVAPAKAPEDGNQALNATTDEGYVEGSEDEPLQPVDEPDTDESGFEEDLQSVKPESVTPISKPKRPAEDVVVVDEAAEADSEIEKLRPKVESKRKPATTSVAQDTNNSPKNTKPTLKTATVVKPSVTEKPQAVKKIATEAEVIKPAGPKRWTIQVGSFGKKENALSMSESLRKNGFPVTMDTIQGEKGTLYRLKIGPDLDGKRASEMKAKLDKQHVKSMLIAE